MNIVEKKINISDELRNKIKSTCKYCKCTYRIKEGHLQILEHSNIGYVSPHFVLIGENVYLFYNEHDYFYSYSKKEKIPLEKLTEYIARH
ncbi:MAG: hypothetical protein RSB67_01805 [Clostridia bacterium]